MTDLHSGVYGGAAPNPFFALIEIISKLKDSKGKILIPGFYKGVKAPTKDELKAWKRLPFNEEKYRKAEVGSKVLTGELGYSVLYRTWARPTLEVHGMPGGFIAAGAKTVIPAKAAAKVSMRLVPNQDADDVFKKYAAYVKKLTPKGIETKITIHSKGPAAVVGTDNPYIKAATEALHDTFKKETVFIRSGGSIPIVTGFQDVLKIPSVMMGFGLPDDNLHAPNEKFHIPNFYHGIGTVARYLGILARAHGARRHIAGSVEGLGGPDAEDLAGSEAPAGHRIHGDGPQAVRGRHSRGVPRGRRPRDLPAACATATRRRGVRLE